MTTRGLMLALLLAVLSSPALASAQPIALHGALRSNGGGPVADGDYVVFVRIYDGEKATKPVWQDTFTPVKIAGGMFSVRLGSGAQTVDGKVLDGSARWIGVQVGADPELPRVPLDWVPYAVHAKTAAGLSCTGCISNQQIATGSIGAKQIGAGVITASHIANGVITGDHVQDASIPASKLKGGKASGLDADKLDGHEADEFVLKGTVVAAGFALNGEQNVDASAPIDVFVRRPQGKQFKQVLLDVWAQPYRHAAPPRMTVAHATDVDFAGGSHVGTHVEGAGEKAEVTTSVGAGDGRDGALLVSGTQEINAVRAAAKSAAKGATSVGVTSTTGFAAGDLVIFAQMAGTGAGIWHQTVVTGTAGGALQLKDALPGSLTTAGGSRAQAVRVQQYTSVTVPSGTTLRGPAWDGATGGIIAFIAQDAVAVEGSIDMTARGFRGSSQKSHAYRNQTGTQGEGSGGTNVGKTTAAAGTGGGGGAGGQDSGGGGGGGHGAAGSAGPACAGHGGGAGGVAIGNPEQTLVFLGGAGGEGGADEDGSYPGRGGNGGGIIAIRGASVQVKGSITTDGQAGNPGCQNCGGSGGGMGGGGGGAGGAVRLTGALVDIQGTVRAAAGAGAAKCSNCCTGGSAGAVGRVTIHTGKLLGKATTPAAKVVSATVTGLGGTYSSAIIDAERADSRITRFNYIATAAGKATYTLEARGANAPFGVADAKPGWQPVKFSGDSPAAKGRWLQYRAVLKGDGGDRPALDSVELLIDRPTVLGTVPSGLKVAIEGQDVPHNAADPKAAGEHVLKQFDLSKPFLGASGGGAVTKLSITAQSPGRVQWLLWIER